jgi:hypothetical protein
MVHYHYNLDPTQENAKALSEIARSVGVSSKILRDCALKGRLDRNGQRHYLEVCRLPCGVGTSKEEYLRFLRKLNLIPELPAVSQSRTPGSYSAGNALSPSYK